MSADDIDVLLDERERTHGDFRTVAETTQSLKAVIMLARPHDMPDTHAEALDAISLKIARILHGNASDPDHWRDVAGYAQLVARELERGGLA